MLRLALLLVVAAPAFAQGAAPDSLPAPPPPPRPTSLFADLRAYGPGDLLTVVLAERTAARRSSSSSAEERARVGGAGTASIGGSFGFDAAVNGARESDSETVQSDLLAGTITAHVVSVDAAGNLVIQGERRLNVDGSTHLMRVQGTVRPADVTPANTVLSHQIAGADVEYRQEATGNKFLRGRFLTLVGTAVVVIGAVVFGASAATGS